MRLNARHIPLLLAGIAALAATSCSTQKNTAKSRFWHAFNAKYNTYYNGTVAYIDGSLEKENGNRDNFTETLPLYYVGNKNSRELGKANFDRAIEKSEKAIKLHSIKKRPQWTKKRRKTERDTEWLNRKEYNPMLWKAWLLMGRSQFHQGDFEAAAATFSYMSRLYRTQPAIYCKARAWLARCYVEAGWLFDAEDVIRNMSRDSIHWSARKDWNSTLADYHIHTGNLPEAAKYLREVIKREGRRKQKAREWYLMGQLQTELGNRQEAYKSFRNVIRQNPPYELEFNARIAMTEVLAQGQARKMISKLHGMARNDNNRNFLDQIYYAIGNIHMTLRDTAQAISAYEKGNEKSTRNGIEKGVLLLRLGDIYWQQEKFPDAARCYGEAVGLLDRDRKDYRLLAERSQKLDLLVPYIEAIHLQDSLQELAKMSEKDRNDAIDCVIEALKRKEKAERDAEAVAVAMQTASQNATNRNAALTNLQTNLSNDTWYFYNSTSVNQGKLTFQRQWGKRANEDHWQRSNKTVVNFGDDEEVDYSELTEEQLDSIAEAERMAEEAEARADSAQYDPHKREFYLAQIPFTPEQLEASDLIIADALYNSGVIFKDKLDKLRLAERQFMRLLTQYDSLNTRKDDVFYHMFLLHSRLDEPLIAQSYVDRLKTECPDSKWTALLSDPLFAENQRFGAHVEDSLYAATYEAFKANRLSEIRSNVKLSADRFPLGANRDKFIFIGGLGKLNGGDADGCLKDMQNIVRDFPQSRLAELAGMILNGVRQGRRLRSGRFDMGDVWARRSAVLADDDSLKAREFTDDPNLDFVFMIAYEPDSVDGNQLLYTLAKYNFTSYLVRNFDMETEAQDGLNVLLVSGFRNYQEALEYSRQFHRQEDIRQWLGQARTYIISQQNRELLGTNFSYEDYEQYYAEHFEPLGTDDLQRLYEPETTDDELDDGGSVPDNLSPFLQQTRQQEEGPEEGFTEREDGINVSMENEDEPTEDNGTTVIEDEAVIDDEAPALPDDGTFIIEEDDEEDDNGTFIIEEDDEEDDDAYDIIIFDDEEGTEDETFELDGFD